MNAILIGFTSTGKTVTGRLLAARLGLRHLDLDNCIVDLFREDTGQDLTVREIFRKLGEEGFVAIENRALTRLEGSDGIVLSTGGRAPMNPDNRPVLKSLGPIIYLKTEPAVIFSRMQVKGLPLYLREDPTVDNLRRVWQQRDPVYRQLANHTVDNTEQTPEETVEAILTHVNLSRG